MSYDQWKTASPYDSEPDPIEEAERWLSLHPAGGTEAIEDYANATYARTVIEMLLAYIKEEI